MEKGGCVYLLASRKQGTLYIGVTSDLLRRVQQHRASVFAGFTAEYGVKRLVWYEQHAAIEAAIAREKAIKKWNRSWKIALLERENPDWDDLAVGLFGLAPMQAGASAVVQGPSAEMA
ncbi:MAG: GIY-YIG nuclease family protein [Polymorphobacter sp.]